MSIFLKRILKISLSFFFLCIYHLCAMASFTSLQVDSAKMMAQMDSAIGIVYDNYSESMVLMDSSIILAQKNGLVEDEYWMYQWRFACQRYWLRFDEIFESYRQMVELNSKRKFDSHIDSLAWQCDLDIRISHVYKDIGEIELARSKYQSVFNQLIQLSDLDSETYQLIRVAKMSLAELHSIEGNYHLASETMSYVIEQELLHAKASNRSPVVQSNYCRLANYERLKGDLESAYEYYRKGLPYFQSQTVGSALESASSKKYLKKFYVELAEVCLGLGKFEEYRGLLNNVRRITDKENKSYLKLLNQEANLLIAEEEWGEVLQLYGVKYKEDSALLLDRLEAGSNIMTAQLNELDYVGYLNSMSIYEDLLSDLDLGTGKYHFEKKHLESLYLKSTDSKECVRFISQSLSEIQSSLYSTGEIMDSKLALEYLRRLSIIKIEALLEQSHIDYDLIGEAFQECFDQIVVIEKSIAQHLLENESLELTLSLKSVNRKISLFENKIALYNSGDVDDDYLNLRGRLFRLREVRAIMLDSLSSNLSVAEIQDLSGANDRFINEGGAVVYFITAGANIFRLYEAEDVRIAVKMELSKEQLYILKSGVVSYTSPGSDLSRINQLSNSLFGLLFEGIDGMDNLKGLKIYGDDFINFIPFESLVHDNVKLIELFPVSYHSLSSKGRFDSPSVLVAPAFESIKNLNFNVQEVMGIDSMIQSSRLIGNAAEFETTLSQIGGAKIIHFATHGIINGQNPDYSYLSLGYDEDNIERRFYQKDILRNDFSSEMVCLTSCESAIGESITGDGAYSMARNFIAAGAKSVISTLWSINDQSSSFIMKEFYKELKKGKRKDEALRQAKLTYLAQADPEYQHPYYWAAFVAMGDMSPLFDPYKKWKIGGTVLAVLLIGGVGYKKYCSSKLAA